MIFKHSSRLLGSVLERRIALPSTHTARTIVSSSTQWNSDPSSSTSSRDTQPGPSSSNTSSSKPVPKSLEEARATAWYLEDDPPPPSSSASSTSGLKQPRFTTFDPSRTTTSSETLAVQPLPRSAPEWLRPLHEYLTSEDGAGDVLETHTVSFMPTLSSPALRAQEDEIRVGAGPSGPLWDWVVVGQVKGTGKGVVGRADRAVRKYIRDNPTLGPIEGFTNTTRKTSEKFPRIAEESDWSLIGIPNKRLCINLFTAEGRERWDLEELWTGKSSVPEAQQAPRNDMPILPGLEIGSEGRAEEAHEVKTLWSA